MHERLNDPLPITAVSLSGRLGRFDTGGSPSSLVTGVTGENSGRCELRTLFCPDTGVETPAPWPAGYAAHRVENRAPILSNAPSDILEHLDRVPYSLDM